MPLHLAPISRRDFIRTSFAAGMGLIVFRDAFADSNSSESHWVFLSDTHIDTSPESVAHGVNMTAHLTQAVGEIVALESKPDGLFITGDCAYLTGQPGNYASFSALIKPLSGAGLPIHIALGNHDHRVNICRALPAVGAVASPVASRLVSIVETPLANWVLLDSLYKTNVTRGLLDEEQLHWLAGALDTRKDKPALVMLHHNPQVAPAGAANAKISGLADTAELYEIILPRKHVKALFYGHTHVWNLKQTEGLHLVNLPASAYVFNKAQPSGWVDCHLTARGMTLELRSLNPAHPAHGKKTELKWRA